jgi:uncharacterized membrane protein
MLLLNTVATVCIGLMIGTEFAVSAFINPVVWKLEERAQARALSLFAAKLGSVMPFWYLLSFVLLLAETIVHRHGPGTPLLVTASVIWAAVMALTVCFLVPINTRMTKLADSIPEEMRRSHKRWDTLHRLRIVALALAMICFLLSGVIEG